MGGCLFPYRSWGRLNELSVDKASTNSFWDSGLPPRKQWADVYGEIDYWNSPRTKMFFSGKRFPFATPSNIDDHISFFASSTLLGLSWTEFCVCVDIRSLIAIVGWHSTVGSSGSYVRRKIVWRNFCNFSLPNSHLHAYLETEYLLTRYFSVPLSFLVNDILDPGGNIHSNLRVRSFKGR